MPPSSAMNSTGETEFKLLKTMSSSTDETIFSEDDSDDSDCDDEEDQEDTEDVLRAEIEEEIGTVGTDAPPPPFETLVDGDGDGDRALSVSVNEEMVEVVPTDMVESVLPIWTKDWNQQQKETNLQNSIQFQRSHTHNVINFNSQLQQYVNEQHNLATTVDIRRNRSEPNVIPVNNKSPSHSIVAGRKLKHYRYGSHPSQPFPNSRTPNPIVVRSSKKIDKRHARYALTAGMMLGIRESVGGALGVEAELEIDKWEEWERCWEEELNQDYNIGNTDDMHSETSTDVLNESSTSDDGQREPSTTTSKKIKEKCISTLTEECQRVTKYKFPPHQFYLGSNTSKPLPHKYKFKVYAPLIFARIRSLFGVEKQPYLHSICGKFNFYEFASNARSGQFFFYSHDGRYMIKTLTYTESKFLREILPYYYRHLSRYPHTFLTHFYGMYRVCMPHLNNKRLHFIIMKSVFSTEKKIDRVWDLKGSRLGRKSNPGDSVAKDLDIAEEGRRLKFARPGAKDAFLEQLRVDATFLARLGIMDYSLLLGMHSCKENSAPPSADPVTNQDAQSVDREEPCRSNTPFRRDVLKRAVTGGTATTANDGFQALEDLDQKIASKSKATQPETKVTPADKTALAYESPLSNVLSSATPKLSSSVPNPITSRADEGIEGGIQLADGTLSVEEIYYCGIIDILQYYNARKIGETVIKQAAGNSTDDISCVDPESYGKRFVKFISNVVD